MLCYVVLYYSVGLYYIILLLHSLRGCAPVHTVWPGGAVLTFLHVQCWQEETAACLNCRALQQSLLSVSLRSIDLFCHDMT